MSIMSAAQHAAGVILTAQGGVSATRGYADIVGQRALRKDGEVAGPAFGTGRGRHRGRGRMAASRHRKYDYISEERSKSLCIGFFLYHYRVMRGLLAGRTIRRRSLQRSRGAPSFAQTGARAIPAGNGIASGKRRCPGRKAPPRYPRRGYSLGGAVLRSSLLFHACLPDPSVLRVLPAKPRAPFHSRRRAPRCVAALPNTSAQLRCSLPARAGRH